MGKIRTIVYNLDRHKNHNDVPSGCFGSYYRVSPTVGLKVLNVTPQDSVQELTKSNYWRTAKRELKWLELAYPSGFTPKPYRVVAVKYTQDEYPNKVVYQPGILMQHIKGKEHGSEEMAERLTQRLEELTGIYHRDCSSHHNIITERYSSGRVKKYWMVDFSPGLLRRTK